MRKLAAAISFLVMAFTACATGQSAEQEKPIEATSEIIVEDAPNTPPNADPFANCQATPQPPGIALQCGTMTGAWFPVAFNATEKMVEANFQAFDQRFPQESKRERFTQKFGDVEAKGLRIFEDGQVAPYRAEILILQTGEKQSLVVSCIQTESTDYTRCAKATETMVTSGIPSTVAGMPQTETGTVGGTVDGSGAGNTGTGTGTSGTTGTGTTGGGTTGTGTTGSTGGGATAPTGGTKP